MQFVDLMSQHGERERIRFICVGYKYIGFRYKSYSIYKREWNSHIRAE